MATGPVCGMTVKESETEGEAVHAGERYYFCPTRCLNDFIANPMAHVHAPHETVCYSVGRRSGKSRGGRL